MAPQNETGWGKKKCLNITLADPCAPLAVPLAGWLAVLLFSLSFSSFLCRSGHATRYLGTKALGGPERAEPVTQPGPSWTLPVVLAFATVRHDDTHPYLFVFVRLGRLMVTA
jgi:hypothetical protein